MPIIAFFGCWGNPGHYLWLPGKNSLYPNEHRLKELNLPSPLLLDGSILFLPQPESIGLGALTYLPAMNRTILAWWGNPWDDRGQTNNAIVIEGHCEESSLWNQFELSFPELVKPDVDGNMLSKPKIITC